MIQLDPAVERQRVRSRRLRIAVAVTAGLCMLASVFLPHVTVASATYYGRSLFRVGFFFLKSNASAPGWGDNVDQRLLAAGINITYFGIALQELGLLLSLFSIWVLALESVGRWVRRLALVAGWCLALSAVLVIWGRGLIERSGVPAYQGVAWVFALAAGLIMIAGGMAARRRLDSTWYWSRPELL